MPEVEIGTVSTFFSHVGAAGIQLTATLKAGDRVHIGGHTTDLEFTVESMQIHNTEVKQAGAGDSVGIKVPDRVRAGDKVYKVA